MPSRILASAASALVVASCASMAREATPSEFRANPHAWVRANIVPVCVKPAALDAIACDCQVNAIASRITEADVAHINEPEAFRAMSARINLTNITFACLKAQKP